VRAGFPHYGPSVGRLIAIACAAAALSLILAGAASSGRGPSRARVAYTAREVVAHQVRLERDLRLAGFRHPGVHVTCAGERPVQLNGHRTGFLWIRCTTNVHILDFLYRRDANGQERMTRVPRTG
jgi:hypothetical protein